MNSVRIACCTVVALMTTLFMTACEQSTGPTKSVEFYLQNADARKAMEKRCMQLESDWSKDPNCVNASTARRAAFGAAQTGAIPTGKFNVPVAK